MDVVELVPGSYCVRTRDRVLRLGTVPDGVKFLRARQLPAADLAVMHDDPWLRGGHGLCGVEYDFWGKLFSPTGFLATGAPLQVVCRPGQGERVLTMLRQAYQGPSAAELEEFGVVDTTPWGAWRDLLAVRDPSGTPVPFDRLVEIIALDGRVRVGDLSLEEVASDVFVLREGAQEVRIDLRLPGAHRFPFRLPVPEFNPTGARLAVHTLGCYPGTDPRGGTTCYRVVANGLEYIIDGMPGLNDVLLRLGIGLHYLKGFLLSHTHQDHVWTAVDRMVSGERVQLFAAPPVYASFIMLAAAIIGWDQKDVMGLVDWLPLVPGTPIEQYGIRFDAEYVVGPVPTTAFRVTVDGASLVFSSDTLSRGQLKARGLAADEIERVMSFCVSGDYNIVDCGGAGGDQLHGAPDDWLHEPTRGNRRIVGTHTSATIKNLETMAPGKVKILRAAPPISPAIAIALAEFAHQTELPLSWQRVLFSTGNAVTVGVGEHVDDSAFVVTSGAIGVYEEAGRIDVLQRGDSFLELGTNRPHRLVAEAPTLLMAFPTDVARALIEGIGPYLTKIGQLRSALLRSQEILISPEVAEFLARRMEAIPYQRGDRIVEQGSEGEYFFIVKAGLVGVDHRKDDGEHLLFGPFGTGFVFGTEALMRGQVRNAAVLCVTPAEVYRGDRETLAELLRLAPGILFSQVHQAKLHARARAEGGEGTIQLRDEEGDLETIISRFASFARR